MAGWTRAATTCPKGNGLRRTSFLGVGDHVPGALFQRLLVSRFPQDTALAKIVSSHLGPAALGGLAAVLFVRLCLFLGLGLGASLVSRRGVGHGDHGGDLCPGALVRNGPGRDLPGFLFGLHAGSARLPGQGRAGVGRRGAGPSSIPRNCLSWLCQGHFSWPYGTTATH